MPGRAAQGSASPVTVVLPPALRNTFNVDFATRRLGFRVARERRQGGSASGGGGGGGGGFDAQGQSTAHCGESDELVRVSAVLSGPRRRRTGSAGSASSAGSRRGEGGGGGGGGGGEQEGGEDAVEVPEGTRLARRLKCGDFLVGLNGRSLLGLTFVEVVAAVLQTPRPLTLRFWRPPRAATSALSSSSLLGAAGGVSSSASGALGVAGTPSSIHDPRHPSHHWQASSAQKHQATTGRRRRNKKQQRDAEVPHPQPAASRVLHQSMLDESECRRIAEHLRPSVLRVADWRLVFSTATHGYRLAGLYDAVRTAHFGPSLLCVRDAAGGHVFGAFVSGWNGGDGGVPHPHFFGSGECFLFSARPTFRVYNWTPSAQKVSNVDFVLAAQDCLAFGGGAAAGGLGFAATAIAGASPDLHGLSSPSAAASAAAVVAGCGQFGLWLDSDLQKGSSAPCLTFGNEGPLSHEQDFEVAAVELWGFV